jgi:hypothetical protein
MVRTRIKTDAANIHNNEIASFYRLCKRYCYTNPAAIAIGVELRSQLEGERASRERIEAEFCELQKNSAPTATLYPFFDTALATITHRQGRIKKRILPNTVGYERRRGHNFQPAPNQAQKIPGVTC